MHFSNFLLILSFFYSRLDLSFSLLLSLLFCVLYASSLKHNSFIHHEDIGSLPACSLIYFLFLSFFFSSYVYNLFNIFHQSLKRLLSSVYFQTILLLDLEIDSYLFVFLNCKSRYFVKYKKGEKIIRIYMK